MVHEGMRICKITTHEIYIKSQQTSEYILVLYVHIAIGIVLTVHKYTHTLLCKFSLTCVSMCEIGLLFGVFNVNVITKCFQLLFVDSSCYYYIYKL